MRGQRKFWMCMAYLVACCVLGVALINKVGMDVDLTSLGICVAAMFGAMGGGVFGLVWGNVKVAQANGNDK